VLSREDLPRTLAESARGAIGGREGKVSVVGPARGVSKSSGYGLGNDSVEAPGRANFKTEGSSLVFSEARSKSKLFGSVILLSICGLCTRSVFRNFSMSSSLSVGVLSLIEVSSVAP